MTSQEAAKLHPTQGPPSKENTQLTLPPSTIDFNHSNIDLIKHLTEQNKKLQEENTKFQTKIITLEKNIRQSNLVNKTSITDTSHKFPLPSQIVDKWVAIAKNDINSCFIEFFSYPEITFHLVQEMFFIMQKMIKEKIVLSLNKTLQVFGIEINNNTNNNNTDNEMVKFLFKILKPFLQEFYYEIFINENSSSVKTFNKTFINNFANFYNNEIIPLLHSLNSNRNNNNSNNINSSTSELLFSVDSIIKTQSFKVLMLNIKEVLLYFELSNQQMLLVIDDFISRELSYIEVNKKDNNVINVNGKTLKNQKQLILMNPPIYEDDGKPHPKYKKIILSFDSENEDTNKPLDTINIDSNLNSKNQLCGIPNSNSTKNVTITPGLSLRSGSYQNIYNFTTEQEFECDEEEHLNSYINNAVMHHHTKANTHLINNHELLFDNSNSHLTTDINNNNNNNNNTNNNVDKIRSERITKITDDYSNNLFNRFLKRKSHTRSLSKKSTITNDHITSSNNHNNNVAQTSTQQQNKISKSKLVSPKGDSNTKKAKIFRLKRKGKEFHLEEISTNINPYMFNIHFNPSLINQNYKTKSSHNSNNNINYLTSHHQHHNSNNNLNHKGFKYYNILGTNSPMAFVKTNQINLNSTSNNNWSINGKNENKVSKQSAKTLNGNRSSKGNAVQKKKNVGYSHHKKNSSLEKNVIEHKTNAFTKLDVEHLLNMKDKKQLMELRKTFVQPNVKIQRVWNE